MNPDVATLHAEFAARYIDPVGSAEDLVPLNAALAETRTRVVDCVASGYVDMSAGALPGVDTKENQPTEILDLVATATADLFRGPNVRAIEDRFRRSREAKKKVVPMRGYFDAEPERSSDGPFEEVITCSKRFIHIFLRSRSNRDHVLVIVCRSSANLGLALMESRNALARVEDLA